MKICCKFGKDRLRTKGFGAHTRKAYWGLEHDPMNIWYKFGKDGLKIKGCRAHTRKKVFGPPIGHKCN